MKVKRYLVDDLPQAVQQIRSELGSDAVILNTKEIRVGGFLGMFRKKKVEVIAAVDEAAARKPASRASAQKTVVRQQAAPEPEQPMIPASLLPDFAVRNAYNRHAAAKEKTDVSDGSATDSAASVNVAPPPQPQPSVSARERPISPEAESSALLDELRSMKEMMLKLSRQQTFKSMPESVMRWSKRLAEQGVEPHLVEQFAEQLIERLDAESATDEDVRDTARRLLLDWLEPAEEAEIRSAAKIVHFVGPTGVGKTTTIAKLAADQTLSRRRSVGLITSDTYRISAVDQLRTYADILNVPLEVVFSPGEAQRAFKKLGDRDLLLMDTAGRNYKNELLVSEVNSMLSPGEEAETILVLSLTHKYADMKAVASQFARYGVESVLLTKTDETESYGSVVNLIREFSFKVPYVTCGQTVPDDIRPFAAAEWVDKLLGEPAYV